MRVWAQEWRTKPDEATQLLLDALGGEGAARLEHGELGDLYLAHLDELLTRGIVFVTPGSHCTYILYPMDEGHALPDTELFLDDMTRINATRVSG